MQQNENIFCLDPTCFTSLDELRDAINVLDEFSADNRELIVYMPTRIRRAIDQNLDRKFIELLNLTEKWITEDIPTNIKRLNYEEKLQYREFILYFLDKYKPKDADSFVGKIRKLGTESIYRDAVIEKYGPIIGEIVFEMLAISSKRNAKIIGFGDKTKSLISGLGITTSEGKSNVKEILRRKRKIRLALKISLFVMTVTAINHFTQQYQIDDMPLPTIFGDIGSTGLFLIGDN